MLPILWPLDIAGVRTPASFDITRAVGYAMAWVAGRFANNAYLGTYVTAAQIIIRANLVSGYQVGQAVFPDGDFLIVNEVDPTAQPCPANVAGLFTTVQLSRALTMIVATKINLYAMNHHTRQGAMVEYAAKVCKAKYNTDLTKQMMSMAHTIGHWSPTLTIWSIAEVQGLKIHDRTLPVTDSPIRRRETPLHGYARRYPSPRGGL